MGYENALFTYGGDLGDYSTYKVDGIVNSEKAVAALEMYRELYQFTPPNWGKTFFQEDNQAITEGLVAMSMNYFAFFPALANPAINPHAEVTGYFANPPGPNGDQHAALGGQGISIVSLLAEPGGGVSSSSSGSSATTCRRSGPSSAATPRSAAILESEEFRNATPYNEAFYQSMFMVKDFWAVPEYAELLIQINNRDLSVRRRRRGHGQGGARRAGGGLGGDLQEVRPQLTASRDGPGGDARPANEETSDRETEPLACWRDSIRGPGRRPAAGATSRSATCSSFRRSPS